MNENNATLPTDTASRKNIPLARGVLDYFPAALAEVAKLSKAGNDKHNPGEDLHWARGKSMDHADCILRHLVDRGTVDPEDGIRHSAKLAWRALALLQEELEAAGLAPMPRGARLTVDEALVARGPEVMFTEETPFKCDQCYSTKVYGGGLSDDEIASYIRNKDWDMIPCANMKCSGHLVFRP